MIEPPAQFHPQDEYRKRISRFRDRMRDAHIEIAFVYSDEYHFENMVYLCGYRPIFEMALLVIKLEGDSLLFTGHEGKTLAQMNAFDCRVFPYSPFSAQGMRQEEGLDLALVLEQEGLIDGMQVGVVGSRYFLKSDLPDAGIQHAVPDFILRSIIRVVGKAELLMNTTSWLTYLPTGIRSKKSAREIAILEEAGTRASRGVLAMLKEIQPGMRERELLGFAQAEMPSAVYSYPPVLHSGAERCSAGLFSPSERIINSKEPVVLYYSPSVEGYSGNSGRSGILASDIDCLPISLHSSMSKLFNATYRSYLSLVNHLCEGANVKRLVDRAVNILHLEGLAALYSPLHSTGLTEWENAFDLEDDSSHLESGQVFQVDFTITSPDFPLCPAKIEDGFAIIDTALREELAAISPLSIQRILSRRSALEKLGYFLDPSVLPLSDLTGQFYPYLLSAGYRSLTDN